MGAGTGSHRRSVYHQGLSIIKVRGEDNVADGLTKQVERSKMDKYMEKCGYVIREGRRDLGPYLGEV